MKHFFVTAVALFSLVVCANSQTRNVLVDSNNRVVSPSQFWSVNSTNVWTNLSLGSAATNPSTAFQAASTNLTSLSTNNGGNLTNIQASSIVGTIGTNSAIAKNLTVTNLTVSATVMFSNALNARTNLGLTWSALTNADAASFASAAGLVSSAGVVAVTNGGTGATNIISARNNLGLSWAALTNVSANQFAIDAGLVRSNGSVAYATNALVATNAILATNSIYASNFVGGIIAITNGGTGTNTAAAARTNLGLGGGYYGVITISNFTGYFSNSATATQTNLSSTNINIWMSNGIITNVTQ